MGSCEVPQQVWGRSIQPFWRLSVTKTNRQKRNIYIKVKNIYVYSFILRLFFEEKNWVYATHSNFLYFCNLMVWLNLSGFNVLNLVYFIWQNSHCEISKVCNICREIGIKTTWVCVKSDQFLNKIIKLEYKMRKYQHPELLLLKFRRLGWVNSFYSLLPPHPPLWNGVYLIPSFSLKLSMKL